MTSVMKYQKTRKMTKCSARQQTKNARTIFPVLSVTVVGFFCHFFAVGICHGTNAAMGIQELK